MEAQPVVLTELKYSDALSPALHLALLSCSLLPVSLKPTHMSSSPSNHCQRLESPDQNLAQVPVNHRLSDQPREDLKSRHLYLVVDDDVDQSFTRWF